MGNNSLVREYFFFPCRDPSKGFFCYAQGYTTHFFCVASFLWTTTIAFTLHRTVVRHKTDVEDLEALFHLYVWGMDEHVSLTIICFFIILPYSLAFLLRCSCFPISISISILFCCFKLIHIVALHMPFSFLLPPLPPLILLTCFLYGALITSCRNFAGYDCHTFYW